MELEVKEVRVDGPGQRSGFGITDGARWFFYAFTTKEKAESILPHFTTETHVRVNVAYRRPQDLVE